MECSVIPFCKKVILVFRYIIYVINILYSEHLVICERFMPVCVEYMILGHTCDEYLVLLAKLGMKEVVQEPCQS
jgi:hypothetical protein